jgi:hypothetical protein
VFTERELDAIAPGRLETLSGEDRMMHGRERQDADALAQAIQTLIVLLAHLAIAAACVLLTV